MTTPINKPPSQPTLLNLVSCNPTKRGATGDLFEAPNAMGAAHQFMSPSLVLEALQPPVYFQRIFADICGGVVPAILFSYLMALREAENCEWFDFDETACREYSGLSKFELRLARKTLKDLKVVEERKDTTRRHPLLRISSSKVMQLANQFARQRWPEMDQQLAAGRGNV